MTPSLETLPTKAKEAHPQTSWLKIKTSQN